MSEARMTSKGQVTVPKDVRLRLNLRPGDRLVFVVEDDGTARVRAVNKSISSLKGVLPPPRRKASVEQIEKAIARGAASDALGHDWD